MFASGLGNTRVAVRAEVFGPGSVSWGSLGAAAVVGCLWCRCDWQCVWLCAKTLAEAEGKLKLVGKPLGPVMEG